MDNGLVTETKVGQDARYLFTMRYACRPCDVPFDIDAECIQAIRAVIVMNIALETAGERIVQSVERA